MPRRIRRGVHRRVWAKTCFDGYRSRSHRAAYPAPPRPAAGRGLPARTPQLAAARKASFVNPLTGRRVRQLDFREFETVGGTRAHRRVSGL